MPGYFAPSASTSPIATPTLSTPGHSVVAPSNQRGCPMTRAVCDAHENARGVRFELGTARELLRHSSHWSFEFEHGTSNIERPVSNGLMDTEPEISNSKNRTSVIDVIAHDQKTGEAVLVMNESNEWDGSDDQLFSLQERFNAYVSFLLDGEMAEAHPELAGKPTRIELRCAHMPDGRALELLGLIHDQLAFQEIRLEVVVRDAAS
jgi:hypothetical protein